MSFVRFTQFTCESRPTLPSRHGDARNACTSCVTRTPCRPCMRCVRLDFEVDGARVPRVRCTQCKQHVHREQHCPPFGESRPAPWNTSFMDYSVEELTDALNRALFDIQERVGRTRAATGGRPGLWLVFMRSGWRRWPRILTRWQRYTRRWLGRFLRGIHWGLGRGSRYRNC